MTGESSHTSWEEYVLRNNAGDDVKFQGRLFSESSFYDEDQGTLTRLKLFVTDDGRQVYSIVSGSSTAKWRRVYTMRVEDELCHISNGLQEISLPMDLLLTVVFGLCGIDGSQSETLRSFIEDTRRAAIG
jgi:hypothetical protein